MADGANLAAGLIKWAPTVFACIPFSFDQAFGHPGITEAGGTLEFRIHTGTSTKFADLLWPRHVLIEMKKRGEKLAKHYQQAFEYWQEALAQRPRYVVRCNFDEFWIYDFDYQLREPVDRVPLDDLPQLRQSTSAHESHTSQRRCTAA
jgi:hypothetical protein